MTSLLSDSANNCWFEEKTARICWALWRSSNPSLKSRAGNTSCIMLHAKMPRCTWLMLSLPAEPKLSHTRMFLHSQRLLCVRFHSFFLVTNQTVLIFFLYQFESIACLWFSLVCLSSNNARFNYLFFSHGVPLLIFSELNVHRKVLHKSKHSDLLRERKEEGGGDDLKWHISNNHKQ